VFAVLLYDDFAVDELLGGFGVGLLCVTDAVDGGGD
jgi:hypothetical protein